jgi:hypothetical protein
LGKMIAHYIVMKPIKWWWSCDRINILPRKPLSTKSKTLTTTLTFGTPQVR